MSDGLSVAVLGAGRMGREHAAAIRAAGDRVRWVIDTDPQSAATLAQEHGAQAGTDLDALPTSPDPDAVVIATPSSRHLAQALRCAHLPTLLEKPPWLADQDPDPLLSVVADRGGLVAVGMTTRFDPAIAAVRRAVVEGRIGRVLSIDDTINFLLADDDLPAWYHRAPQRGGGIVQTNGVHALDRVCWILGEIPRLVTARTGSTDRELLIQDNASIILATATATITISLLWSRFDPPASTLLVTGTRGTATGFADGSWAITTIEGTDRGPATPDRNNYLTQWKAFRTVVRHRDLPSALPQLRDLIGPMRLLSAALAARQQ